MNVSAHQGSVFISESLKARISKTDIVTQLSDGIKLADTSGSIISASIFCATGTLLSEHVKLISYTKKKKVSKLKMSLPLKYLFTLTKDTIASVNLVAQGDVAHTFVINDTISQAIKIENNDRILLKLSFC
jgi:hypothetical protein